MFVDTVQFVDIPKRVVPTHVRLYREQDFFRADPHLLYFSCAHGRTILLGTLGAIANGEICSVVGGSSTGLNQLPSEVIEGTSEVVNHISDDYRKLIGNGLDALDVKRRVMNLGYRVRLGSNFIRLIVGEKSDPLIKFEDMLFGPFNFEPNSVDSRHDIDGVYC